MNRLEREKKTVKFMIQLYCNNHHNFGKDKKDSSLCSKCLDLREYSLKRLKYCQFGKNKPTCAKCPIHCYKKDKKDEIRVVMRWSGPRMITMHPYLALAHLIDMLSKPQLEKKFIHNEVKKE